MNAAQRNRHAALLRAAGYEDGTALTLASTEGEIPQGRELSFAWLAGTVMTGLTSVMLMGAALYVSFQGQDTFSTAFEALAIGTRPVSARTASLNEKTDRVKPVARTRSDREIIEATIREPVDGRMMIRKQPFVRIAATLATAGTALSDDIPPYDPVALLNTNDEITSQVAALVSTDIYGAEVEGEVAVSTLPLSLASLPTRTVSDRAAAEFVRQTIDASFTPDAGDGALLAYAPPNQPLREVGAFNRSPVSGISGIAENVTIVPQSSNAANSGLGRTERIVTMKEPTALAEALTKNGFSPEMVRAIGATLRNVFPSPTLATGSRLRILFGAAARGSQSLIPYRMSIYLQDQHAVTVALTDRGRYVVALAPPDIEFPEEDTEEINVNALPSIYRSIWETGRKHDLPDQMIERIITLYAYDLELNKRIAAGDTIEILQTPPDDAGRQDLLYVGITLGSIKREFYRFVTPEGAVEYYDPDGQTGKRFLQRRPLQGGGTLRSRFGNRKHPVYGTYRLHSGIDLAAPYGTPIFAAGDGVVERAQWVSGYGRYVELDHVNGYSTAYAHMSRIAESLKPGMRVRQGQIIGYVGSTGVSTGNHLHFEIKINGRFVDPLSVKLPRDKTLPSSHEREFNRSVAQIRELMTRDAAPVTTAGL